MQESVFAVHLVVERIEPEKKARILSGSRWNESMEAIAQVCR
jgi:hypothetical protein